MALVQPKKVVGGAFGRFLLEKRTEFMKATEGQKASAVSKMAGEEWNKLSAEQRAPYQKKYEAAKVQYDEDLRQFLQAGGVVEKGPGAARAEKRKLKEGKKQKDGNAPKRPAGGAYGVFVGERREDIKRSLPKDHKITDVSKKASELWKAVSEEEKKTYETKYQSKQAEYKAAMEDYNKNKPASEQTEDATPTKKRARAASKDSPETTSAPKAARGRKAKAPAEKGAKEVVAMSPDMAEALKAAEELGYESALKNLAARPEILSLNLPAAKILTALKESGGLVNPAKNKLTDR